MGGVGIRKPHLQLVPYNSRLPTPHRQDDVHPQCASAQIDGVRCPAGVAPAALLPRWSVGPGARFLNVGGPQQAGCVAPRMAEGRLRRWRRSVGSPDQSDGREGLSHGRRRGCRRRCFVRVSPRVGERLQRRRSQGLQEFAVGAEDVPRVPQVARTGTDSLDKPAMHRIKDRGRPLRLLRHATPNRTEALEGLVCGSDERSLFAPRYWLRHRDGCAARSVTLASSRVIVSASSVR